MEKPKMISKFVLTLLITVICDAKININITVASKKDETIIKFYGADNKLITEKEIALYNISMDNINRGMRVELGKVPDGVFLKDPTPYGNLFHKYKWPEVHRSLYVDKIEIGEIFTEEVVLKTHEHINNSTDDVKSYKSLFTNVELTAFSNWSQTGYPADDIKYFVNITYDKTTFTYENKWRSPRIKSSLLPFGKPGNRTVTFQPGKGIVKKLKAKKTIMFLKVEYVAKLIGNLIADYENLYGKYHFYSPNVNNIMRAAKIPNEIRTTETIEVKCYTDPKVEIYDRDSGTLIVKNGKRLFWKNLDKDGRPKNYGRKIPNPPKVNSTSSPAQFNLCLCMLPKGNTALGVSLKPRGKAIPKAPTCLPLGNVTWTGSSLVLSNGTLGIPILMLGNTTQTGISGLPVNNVTSMIPSS